MDSSSFWTLVGGVGLFLLGMSLMTDGLTAMGTRALRRLMGRVTKSRMAALATGAGVTAVVQSSSATTLVTVSFVSAGIVSFSQSIAIMLGSNVGTTSTAWIVSLIGFKVDSAAFALPAVGIGSLIRLVSRGRRAAIGLAIAGFGLVFLGIDALQAGMAGVADTIDLGGLGGHGFLGILLLFGVGALMTVLMQSSSAAAATTLAAVNAGSINFEQAAALIIGQNVGTTVTAIIGAVGGSLSAKRAATAHAMFNVSAGVIALILLTPFTAMVSAVGESWVGATPEVMVALFHTFFNVLGVVLILPFLGPFARLIERMVPERGGGPTRRLVTSALEAPSLAIEAARRTGMELGAMAVEAVDGALESAVTRPDPAKGLLGRAARLVSEPRRLLTGEDSRAAALESLLGQLSNGLESLRGYLGRIRATPDADGYSEHLAVVYAADQLQRLDQAARNRAMLEVLKLDPRSDEIIESLRAEILPVAEALAARVEDKPTEGDLDGRAFREVVDHLRESAAARRLTYRAELLARMAAGELSAADTDELLDANRWLADLGRGIARTVELLIWPDSAGALLTAGDVVPEDTRAAREEAAAAAVRTVGAGGGGGGA